MYSFAVSIFAVGGMLGGFSGGMIADRFGRFVSKQFLHILIASLINIEWIFKFYLRGTMIKNYL